MNRIITYAVDKSNGLVVSRVGNELAWPILDFEGMTPANDFQMSYNLEKVSLDAARYDWPNLRWTKKIPVSLKNLHREFWGMKPIAG